LTRYGISDIILKMGNPVKDLTNMKGVVPFEETPTMPQDTEWDAGEARQRIAKWASSDGSGDKNKIDWAKYRRAFLWVDPEVDPETFGAYHLPHHDVSGGELKVNFRGCVACVVVLRGGRGGAPRGMTTEDIERCENHLKKHYEQFGVEFPEKGLDIQRIEAGVSPKMSIWYRIWEAFSKGGLNG